MATTRKHRRSPIRSPYRQSPWLIAAAIVVAVGAVVLVAAALMSF